MKHHFTQKSLIRFIYKEATTAQRMALADALHKDRELYGEFCQLRNQVRELPKLSFQPSDSSIQKILRYSEQSAVETQP